MKETDELEVVRVVVLHLALVSFCIQAILRDLKGLRDEAPSHKVEQEVEEELGKEIEQPRVVVNAGVILMLC
jgi:hypothetical protein